MHFTGAVALESTYPSSSHRFVNAELNCSGLESKITSCIQNMDDAYSCLSFGIASISCYGKFANSICYAYLVYSIVPIQGLFTCFYLYISTTQCTLKIGSTHFVGT